MRLLSYLLFFLALALAGLAVYAYLYAQGMSCAYALDGGGCRLRLPWELGREDIVYLVLVPWTLVALLTAGAVALFRKSRRPRA